MDFKMNLLNKIKRKAKDILLSNKINPDLNVNCSEFEVNNWVISKFIINKLIPKVGIHPYPISELNLMVAAICRLKPKHVFEWGTNIGKSARIFHETSKFFKIDLHIHSIDLPDDIDHQEHPRSDHAKMIKGKPHVTLHRGDGLNKTLEIYKKCPIDSSPLIFIDGDHSYEAVKRELKGILLNMPEANILLHDTFYQSEKSGYNIGPYQAVQDVLKELPNQFKVISTTTGLPGMTLLYR